MMKKVLSFVLTVVMVMSMSVTAFAAENEAKEFDIWTSDGQHITAAVLVENGEVYQLTENEYVALMNEDAVVENTNETELQTDSAITPMASYSFSPTKKTLAYAPAVRVSAIYSNATKLSVTSTTTYTRTVTETGGVTVTTGIKNVVDASVATTYSLSVSGSSSKSVGVTGEFKPSGNYTYSAIIFSPRIAIVDGTLKGASKSYSMKWHYPVTGSNGLLDGVYALCEENNASNFPALG